MFEKLSKLLFEDEEVDDEEYDDEEYDEEEVDEAPVKTKSKHKGGLFGKGKGGLLHIDDDDEDDEDDDDFIQRAPKHPTSHVQAASNKPDNEPQPVAKTYLKSEPIPAAKSLGQEQNASEQTVRLAKINMTSTDINETIKPTNKQSFGLDVNEITYTEAQPKARVVEPTVSRETRETRSTNPYQPKSMSVEKGNEFGGRVIEAKPVKKPVEPVTTTYMFQPVISPMFGINDREKSRFEKDSEKVQATLEHQAEIHRTANEPVETTKEFGQVLSPMYGTERMPLTSASANIETMDGSISKPLENVESAPETTDNEPALTAVPYQSLDDLIKEGRSTASTSNLEATKAFRFEDLLKDDESESDKTVESVYAGKDLFSSVDEDHE